jgi:DNA polymerase-3 subunit delta'
VFLFNHSINPSIKEKLVELHQSNRVPHGLLLNGKEGSGHFQLGLHFAAILLCKNPGKAPCGECSSCLKLRNFQHPDLHFSFPIHLSKTQNSEISDDQVMLFLEMIRKYKCIGKNNWYSVMGNENKQGVIGVKESQSILKKLSLKSFEGGPKVLIMWLAEMMNVQASNKLLKLIEEPPEKTFFIFITDNNQNLLPTINSRLQKINVPSLTVNDVQNFLISDFNLNQQEAFQYASISNGNLNKAIDCYFNESSNSQFLLIFIKWMRLCYSRNIAETIDWVNEFSKTGREQIKNFLLYCLEMFRNCLMDHYNINLDGLSAEEKSFLEKFKPFINHNNIINLTNLVNEAHFHIERNANAKILLLDVSIQLFKLLKVEAYHSKTS